MHQIATLDAFGFQLANHNGWTQGEREQV